MTVVGRARPRAVLVTGPLRLFRTNGIYYLRELARTYDVVLVGWDDYAGDASVETACAWPGVVDMRLLPPAWEPRAHYRATAALAEELRAQIRPRLLLQHNDCYPHNLQLIRAMPLDAQTLRATYTNGLTLDFEQDSKYVRGQQIDDIRSRRRLPLPMARWYFNARSMLRHQMRFTLLPLATGSRPLPAYRDLDTGRIKRRDTSNINDVYLAYTERERFHYQNAVQPGAIELIRHPLLEVGEEVHGALGMPTRTPRIVFLPTWGPINTLAEKLGGLEPAIAAMGETWSHVLSILRVRLGGIAVCAKLHPAAAKDAGMIAVMARLRAENPDLAIIDPLESAERLILGSTCVVGDISAVQWWAWLTGGRIVVSVDAWGLPGGDEFRHYPGIVYVKDPKDLETAVLEPPVAAATPALPTLTEVLGRFARARN